VRQPRRAKRKARFEISRQSGGQDMRQFAPIVPERRASQAVDAKEIWLYLPVRGR